MLTLIIGLTVAAAAGIAMHVAVGGVGWSILVGILAFLLVTILINLVMKKRLERVFAEVQGEVEGTQDKLRRKINQMQTKNVSGGKGLQRRMEKEQADGIRKALKKLDRVVPLQKWNFLAQRQANTLRAQLYFQIKEFEKADTCFEKCLILDALTLAMKMVRLYKRGEMEKVEKAFKRGVKRYKDEDGTILYALYTWILVKEDRVEDAVAILEDGKEKTEDETLRINWEHLANKRVRRFSNAPLGDQWYALHLETPKPVKVKQRMGGRRFR